MLDELADKNVLILKNGELETNLNDAKIAYTGNKNLWIENAIDYIEKTESSELEKLDIAKLIKKMEKQIIKLKELYGRFFIQEKL